MASVSKRLIIITFVINLFKKIALTTPNVNPTSKPTQQKTGIFFEQYEDIMISIYSTTAVWSFTYLDPSNTVWWGRLWEQNSSIGLWCREKSEAIQWWVIQSYNHSKFFSNAFSHSSRQSKAYLQKPKKLQPRTQDNTKDVTEELDSLRITWPHFSILESDLFPQTNFLLNKHLKLILTYSDACVKGKMAVTCNLE